MKIKIFSKKTIFHLISITIAVLAIGVFGVTLFSIPPSDFPISEQIRIEKGTYMSQTADLLKEQGFIRSKLFFKIYVVLLSGHKQIQAGDYVFEKPESVLRIAYRTIHGIQGIPKVRITLFEGMTAEEMANSIEKSIPDFDKETFITLAKPYEGYLFPDTYFLDRNVQPQDIVTLLRETFTKKIKTVLLDIQASGRTMSDIITMASIVEREARNSTDRKLIAGILWKRIEAGMPLQVDVPFYYILKKGSAQISLDDLAIDSPYNLYKHTGLTPTPISNPGLTTIMDTVNATKSDYWFYLADNKGVTHYAKDHDGHVANKRKYIP
ncbi:MAG: endolytic transglycosylase MltG [Candidatus Paceibacterota bacterium]|jgi:UPF0755 protein